MTTTFRTKPAHSQRATRGEQDFGLSVVFDGDSCIVRVTGELDLAALDRLFLACTAPHHVSLVVDLSGLIFMDYGGYGGIVAARNVIEADGRTLTVRGARGQPGHLLALIAHIERQPPLVIEPADPVEMPGVGAQPLRNGEPA